MNLKDLIKQATPLPWYLSKSAGEHHGIVASEETGATAAVTYHPNDAPLINHAVNMLPRLVEALDWTVNGCRLTPGEFEKHLRALLIEANNPEME